MSYNAGKDKLAKTQSLIQLVDKDWAQFLKGLYETGSVRIR